VNINSLNTESSRGLAGAYSGFEHRGVKTSAMRFDARRAESGDGVLGDEQLVPFPPTKRAWGAL